jgi:hypothetical protein
MPARSITMTALLLSACAFDPATEIAEAPLAGAGGAGCPLWGCGENTAQVGDYSFHELDLLGDFNDAGVRIRRFVDAGGVERPIDVRGTRLRAYDHAAKTWITGAALAGSTLQLESSSGDHFGLLLYEVGTTDLWVGPSASIETYRFRYQGAGGVEDLCGGWAILTRGDRYDAATKRVTAIGVGNTGGWFNVACAATAMSKLALLRLTTATQDADHLSTWDDRTAALKAITADVCDTGRSFTANHEPLLYEDHRGWFTIDTDDVVTYEAIWRPDGAVCLDVPRYIDKDPKIAEAIEAECGNLPPCGKLLGDKWQAEGLFLTASPE